MIEEIAPQKKQGKKIPELRKKRSPKKRKRTNNK